MKFRIPYWQLLIVPAALYCVGWLFNSLAVVANHGQMPYMYPGGCPVGIDLKDIFHVCMSSASRLKIVSDWVEYDRFMESPGDVILTLFNYTLGPCLGAWLALVVKEFNER